jgi:hypothetical protein
MIELADSADRVVPGHDPLNSSTFLRKAEWLKSVDAP